ncbi:dephospho-CoA kinase [Litorimonas cladophorae]|uniref:Dephospho-CoA kinase n=1 Tax=Litorimonas cladophorae TaxID=1220491 RepID=A0A918NH48_9PROT|nr:dephospho-CoA kinase [Litorimonas cladophorae]GGX67270.1 dephospho-CoA kinase [Litorimonas cladophorae]
MKIIGLTGSIGMGKSTTAQMFAELGCPVFDADAAVHEMYAEGGRAVPLIRAVFPDAIKDDAVDRTRLGDHMRADPLNLKVLESFIHPWVGEMRQAFLTQSAKAGAKAVVFDVPLLFETGGDKSVDATVVVSAAPEVQRERVMARPGMTEALFEMILSKQMPDAEKRKRADYIVRSDAGLEAARTQVAEILDQILHT